MGNTHDKSSKKNLLLSDDELKIVESLFKSISKNLDRLKEADLVNHWQSQLDAKLTDFNCNFLFGPLTPKSTYVDFERFAELYVFSIRGNIDERAGLLLCSLGYQNDDEENEITVESVQKYVEAVVSSYMLTMKSGVQFKSWTENGISDPSKQSVQQLSEELTYAIVQDKKQTISRPELEDWLEANPTFVKMLKTVFTNLYNYRQPKDSSRVALLELDPGTELLPICEDHEHKEFPALIDLAQIVFINSNLPTALQSEWRFLFSSVVHGSSFSALLRKISHQGPTVLIVEDTNGHVFGGFAPDSWTHSSEYVGNNTAFLFNLQPKMRYYPTTGYNNHYQYLNLHQQTMPNGLGMGGQFEFWGLWLNGEFGTGESAESCTTFMDYKQLSATKNFEIKNVEVWAVGPKPQPPEDDEEVPREKSVVDNDPGTKTFIEMAGHDSRSDGFREPQHY